MKNNLMALYLVSLAFTAPAHAESFSGNASYYGLKGQTASGSRVGAFTAAHRSLPFGSKARVTNLKNKRSVNSEHTKNNMTDGPENCRALSLDRLGCQRTSKN